MIPELEELKRRTDETLEGVDKTFNEMKTADERAKALPRETRQAILDDLKAHMSVGEIVAKRGLDTWIVWGVIQQNMRTTSYMNWVAD